MLYKPLTLEEIPEEDREYFDLDSQFQQSYQYAGRTKMRAMLFAKCPVCNEYTPVPVNDVRNWIKGRRQRPGTHRKCKYSGSRKTSEGYVMLYMPKHPNAIGSGYIQEHVYVMEQALGRHLDKKVESVHHIDGDKTNNSLDNLQLRFSYHGKGQAWKCNSCGSNDVQPTQLA